MAARSGIELVSSMGRERREPLVVLSNLLRKCPIKISYGIDCPEKWRFSDLAPNLR